MEASSRSQSESSGIEGKFDGHGILPKQETQAWQFLKSNPKGDGRGIVVAILDTGIDPGAPGLQKTSTGERKVVDLLDCTGSGDIDTSTIREATNGQLIGLTGRNLAVGELEPCPSGKYYIGMKRAYELMPKSLVTRTTTDRKEKFEKFHREHLNELHTKLNALNKKIQASSGFAEGEDLPELAGSDKQEKEELAAQIEQAESLMSAWSDPGPLYDVVAWKAEDGEWRVIVDTSETGDVKSMKVLKPFRVDGDYSNFGSENMLNYSVNVWNEGSIVEIVVNAGGHGTHVAGIVGAYVDDGNALNGVAPGCQLIGLKIGDSRLGSMETGVGLVRALIAARERKVDIINMSYGEPASLPNSGRIPDLINELVHKHGIIFVTSASNSGPCLTTVGSPGASTHAAIAVGAMVSPAMMAHQYSMRETLEQGPYNWSSRGPSLDGGYGPSIAAPGGAIAPVPNWTLQKSQLMNGTSMASPNACGCITLILSALKQSSIAYSPSTIRLAVENTAREMPKVDYTAQGHGVIQVADAYDYCLKNQANLNPKIRISANLPNRNNARGILLRDKDHFHFDSIEEMIQVDVHFGEGTPSEDKINFETRFAIHSTVPWISHPEFLLLVNNGRSFKVNVQPPNLSPEQALEGAYFLGEIYGVDLAHPELGTLFTVPVTVIRPAQVHRSFIYNNLPPSPGVLYRRFYTIPTGATWATITLKSNGWHTARTALLSCQQVIPDMSHKLTLFDKYFMMKGDDERESRIPVQAGLTLEVVAGQLWSALGSDGTMSFSVEFSGVTVDSCVAPSSYGAITRLMLNNALGTNIIQIKPQLVAVSRTLSPTSISGITPLSADRDMLTNQKLIYQLTLTYLYTTEESNIKILPRLPSLSRLLYESPFESQLIMIYDSNKALVKTVDYNPEWFTLNEKGTYTIRMQLRHNDTSILEKQKTLSLNIERQLPKEKAISLNVYQTLSAAISNTKKFPADGTRYVSHPVVPIYVQAPNSPSQLPSYVKQGDVLYGYMSLVKLEGVKNSYFVDTGLDPFAVGVVPIKFIVPSKPSSPLVTQASTAPTSSPSANIANQNTSSPNPTSKPSTPVPLPIAASVSESASLPSSSLLSSVSGSEAPQKSPPAGQASRSKTLSTLIAGSHALLAQLQSANKYEEWLIAEAEISSYFPFIRDEIDSKLQWCSYRAYQHSNTPTEETKMNWLAAADNLLASVDQTALAVYLGTRHPTETAQEKAQVEKTRTALTTALQVKLSCSEKSRPEYALYFAEICKWIDPTAQSIAMPSQMKPGAALKALRKKTPSGEKMSRSHTLEMLKLLETLGWTHWVEHVKQWNAVRFASTYAPF